MSYNIAAEFAKLPNRKPLKLKTVKNADGASVECKLPVYPTVYSADTIFGAVEKLPLATLTLKLPLPGLKCSQSAEMTGNDAAVMLVSHIQSCPVSAK